MTDDDLSDLIICIGGLTVAIALALGQGCRAPAGPPLAPAVAAPADPTPTVALPLVVSPADAPTPATLSAVWRVEAL